MMLNELQPELYTLQNGHRNAVENVAQAAGLIFTCPTCLNHPIVITFKGPVYDHGWDATGNDCSDISITPSIEHFCTGHPHFFITAGAIVFC